MKNMLTRSLLVLCSLALVSPSLLVQTHAQEQTQGTPQAEQDQPEDVLRITTELVQTDVSVFDKDGRFVEGLKQQDFELRVDGRPQAVSFFDRVTAGSADEEAQLAAARGAKNNPASAKKTGPVRPLDRGRMIVFFVDDFHLAADSLKRSREFLTNFIDKEMGQNDQLMIASTSGQVGFLQQFTDNKMVLREAVSRLSYKQRTARDLQSPPMSEYQALLIDRNDSDVLNYYVERYMRDFPGTDRNTAAEQVRTRARTQLSLAASVTKISLSTLDSLTRMTARLAGRKLFFFISDGFFIDPQRDTIESLRRITDGAARAGVIIYTMEARGLISGQAGAAEDVAFDPSGRLGRASASEMSDSQDGLNALAVDTGGRAIRNTNAPFPAMRQAVQDTSAYYLLAWRPDSEQVRGGKFRRVEVSVRNRPELSVRVQRGFLTEDTGKQKKTVKAVAASADVKTVDNALRDALTATFPRSDLPVELSLSYLDVPSSGLTLMSSIKITGGALELKLRNGKQAAVVDIAGGVFNSQGKQLDGFRERLTVTPTSTATRPQFMDVNYNYRALLKPGLYQVRVAVRDEASGQAGSALQWIEVPDLSARKLSLSSLLVGERKPGEQQKGETTAVENVPISVDRRFERTSYLRFLVYIYNAQGASGAVAPDVALQVQIFRDNQPVVTTPLRKLSTESQDLARLAYAAEIPLQAMTAGHYVLQVTAIDRIAKTSASQRVRFEIQ